MDVLTEKSYLDYPKLSRYATVPYYYNMVDKKYIYGTGSQLNNNVSYKLHQVEDGETLDSIARDYYGNPTYYWIICDFNHIQDPFIRLVKGALLRVPEFSQIEFID